jgi:benzoylformate decarboxylase
MTTLQEARRREPSMLPLKLGRDVIFDYLREAGVDQLFGVPGTNEIPIIDGTDVPDIGIRYVPCLHENIALGAAMGYARSTGKPGVVELHVTPGIGHAIGNLYNAAKSHIPVVVLCGQQHSNLIIQEPLLESNLVKVAEQYTKWAYEVRGPNELGMAMQRAMKTALAPPYGPVFLSIPWEFTIRPALDPDEGRFTRIAHGFTGAAVEIEKTARLLAEAERPIIVAGDGVGAAGAWDELADLASELNDPDVYSEPLSSYMNFRNDDYRWQGELPGLQKKMRKIFAEHDVAFLCGFNAQAQLVVFDWDEGPLIPESVRQVYLHNDPWQIGKNYYGEAAILGDIKATLPLITDAIREPNVPVNGRESAPHQGNVTRQRERLERVALIEARTDGRIPGERVATTLRRLQDRRPELKLTVVNEAVSDSGAVQKHLAYDTPTSYFFAQGGSLGYSMPAALGFRLGEPADRTVINLVGDGSALFYPQSWWTAMKLSLPILYVVLNNQEYKTLIIGLNEIEKTYRWRPDGKAEYLRLKPPPPLDYVTLAESYGIEGEHVVEAGELEPALIRGLDAVRGTDPRPYLIEVLTSADLPPSDPKLASWFDQTTLVP